MSVSRVAVHGVGSISQLVFGCASVGGRVSQRASLRAMSEALDAGITTFDVARSYGYGDAEQILGRFVRGRRNRVQIVTKAGILSVRPSPLVRAAKTAARGLFRVAPSARLTARGWLGRQQHPGHFEPREIEASLVASLRALGTDYVDVLLLHGSSADTARRSDVHEIMAGFVTRGLVRRVGIAADVRAAIAWVERGGEPTAELPATEIDGLACVAAQSALWLANQPLGGGPLLAKLAAQCEAHGLPRQLALSFLLQRPFLHGAHAIVASMLSVDHLRHAIDSLSAPQIEPDLRVQLEQMLKVTT